MNEFFQVMWRDSSYFQPGPYFATKQEGIDFLKEDAKERAGRITFFRGDLETRSFGPELKDPMIVARQVESRKHDRKLLVLALDPAVPAPK